MLKTRRFGGRALCAAAFVLSFATASLRAADSWTVPELLPKDSLFVIQARDVSQMIEKVKKTGVYNIVTSSEALQAFREPLLQATRGIDLFEMFADDKLPHVLSYFAQGEICLSVTGLTQRDPSGIEAVLSIQLKGKAGGFAEDLVKRLDQAKALTGGALVINTVPPNVNYVTLPNVPFSVSYTIVDGNFILAIGDKVIEKLLKTREQFKAARPTPKADGAEVLGQMPAFAKAQEKAGPDADLLAWVNVDALVKNQALDLRPKDPQGERAWELLNVPAIRGLLYSIGAKDKGVKESFFIDIPAAQRKGVLGLIDAETTDLPSLNNAPKNSLFAGAIKLDPEKLFENVLNLIATQNAELRQAVTTQLAFVSEQLKIDIKKEVFAALTGQGGFSVNMPGKNPKLPIGAPQLIFSLGVKDAAALQRVLGTLRTAADEKFSFSEMMDLDHTIVSGRERVGNGHVSWVVTKGEMLVSLYPLALREELRRRAGMSRGLPATQLGNLSEDTDFKTARAALKDAPQGLLYYDSAALGTAAYDLLVPVLQLAPNIPPQIDVNALPTSDLLVQFLGGTVVGWNISPDGITVEGFSPSGVLTSIPAAIGGIITGYRAQQRGLVGLKPNGADAAPQERRGRFRRNRDNTQQPKPDGNDAVKPPKAPDF